MVVAHMPPAATHQPFLQFFAVIACETPIKPMTADFPFGAAWMLVGLVATAFAAKTEALEAASSIADVAITLVARVIGAFEAGDRRSGI